MPASARKRKLEEPAEPKRQRRTRRKKDPTAPKKPLSSFVFFSQEMRPKVNAKNPDMGFTEVGTELGKLWAKQKNRTKWDKQAEVDKKRYTKEMETYVPDPTFLQQSAKNGNKRLKKDPAKPKRSRSAYLIFCDKHRPALQKKHSDEKMVDLAKKLAVMWSNASAKEKQQCQSIAEKEKKEYEKKLENYVPSEEYKKAIEANEAAKQAAKEKAANAKSKQREKIKKVRGKVKELKDEITKIEKKVAAAAKLEVKVAGLKQELEKTESKLSSLGK